MNTMTCKGFKITEKSNGRFNVRLTEKDGRVYEEKNLTFKHAGEWVYDMAPNNDIGREVNHKMCDRFQRSFFSVTDPMQYRICQ